MDSPFNSARSFLFVPGNRPERFAKALAAGPDAVIVDLEDAVALPEKEAARHAIAAVWQEFDAAQHARMLVRVNAPGTQWGPEDLALCANLGVAGVVLPKAERTDELQTAAACLGGGVALLPIIESAAGWHNVHALAAHPSVARLMFGHIDFQADLGMSVSDDESELLPVRLALVVASRLANLAPPVDGVTVQTDNAERLEQDTLRARRLGFGGKLCIHPRQVAGVHAALMPTAAEADWARRVLDAAQAAQGGAVALDGKMVDRPVILLAERILRTLALARG